jgi:hypothetical protein
MVFPKAGWVFFGPNNGYAKLLGDFRQPNALTEYVRVVLNRRHQLRLHVDDEQYALIGRGKHGGCA